jgi:NhaP-type Na+/H+ or K+/H+ antiporter
MNLYRASTNKSTALLVIARQHVQPTSMHGHAPLLSVFLFCGILLGAIISYILSRLKLQTPYTVVLFVVGALLSGLASHLSLGDLETSMGFWQSLDPEIILFLFLPVLVFGEAMTLKWHHIKEAFLQSALLAGPGVVIGAYLVGGFINTFLPFNWSWNLCMIFGSIISATDTVAVVALLKRSSASPKLTILIKGESLMNDGTAIVLFSLFLDQLVGVNYSSLDILFYIFRMIILSPLLGLLLGLFTVFLMSFINSPLYEDDVTIQILLTLSSAYLSFFIAQYECSLSGILSCFAAGTMLSWFGPTIILEHETMHHVWVCLEWTGNTLVFLLAGLIVGNGTIQRLDSLEWGWLFLLYLIVVLTRYMTIGLLYPILSRVGVGCSLKDCHFMAWTGFRGAVAIALSLIVQHDSYEQWIPREDRDRIFFYVGGIAALTLLINATTSQTILELASLHHGTNPDKPLVIKQITDRLIDRLQVDVTSIQKSLKITSTEEISKYNSLLTTQSTESIHNVMMNLSQHGAELGLDEAEVSAELLGYLRHVFLEMVRSNYLQAITEGKLPRLSSATQLLLHSIDMASNDHESSSHTSLKDWDIVIQQLDEPSYFHALLRSIRLSLLPSTCRQCCSFMEHLLEYLDDRFVCENEELRVYILTNFIEAHEIAQNNLKLFLGNGEGTGGEGCHRLQEGIILKESESEVRQTDRLFAD